MKVTDLEEVANLHPYVALTQSYQKESSTKSEEVIEKDC